MPRLSDPRRLPRRNHYQEGPDFLFVATQGGRPPAAQPHERIASVVRRRRGAIRRLEAGEPPTVICSEAGCSLAALYRWRERHRVGGRAARGAAAAARPGRRRAVLLPLAGRARR